MHEKPRGAANSQVRTQAKPRRKSNERPLPRLRREVAYRDGVTQYERRSRTDEAWNGGARSDHHRGTTPVPVTFAVPFRCLRGERVSGCMLPRVSAQVSQKMGR